MNKVIFLASMCLIAACEASDPYPYHDDPIPAHELLTVHSDVLQEDRIISVYLPPEYSETATAYPVLYMPDGGLGEDFPHVVNTVDALIAESAIAPVLVVGIENTVRRRDLTPDSQDESEADIAPLDDGATRFRSFIRDELMPEINEAYRTTDETAIIGESAAGLFIIDSLFREPALFDRYIAMDPSIYWDDHELVRLAPERMEGLSGRGLTLWFTAAGTEEIYPYTDMLAEILETEAPEDLRWVYDPRREEEHWTIYRATKEDALRWAMWPAED